MDNPNNFPWFDLAWLRQWWPYSPRRKPRSTGPATRLFCCKDEDGNLVTVEARTITGAKVLLREALKRARPPRTRDIEVKAA